MIHIKNENYTVAFNCVRCGMPERKDISNLPEQQMSKSSGIFSRDVQCPQCGGMTRVFYAVDTPKARAK